LIKEAWGRRKQGAYLALRVAIILEEFAERCLDFHYDNDAYLSSGGLAGDIRTRLPELSKFPQDDEGWRAFPLYLSEMALMFPRSVASGNSYLAYVDFYESNIPQHTAAICGELAIEKGVEAVKVASELRQAYNFKPLRDPFYGKLLEERQRIEDASNASRRGKCAGINPSDSAL